MFSDPVPPAVELRLPTLIVPPLNTEEIPFARDSSPDKVTIPPR